MEAEDLVLDHSGEGQVIEELSKLLPDVGITILAEALVVEPIYLSDLSRLVVSSEDSESVLIADFKGDKQGYGLDRVVSSVDVVTHEQIVGVWRMATNLEELAQVMELPVDVSAYCDGGANLTHI